MTTRTGSQAQEILSGFLTPVRCIPKLFLTSQEYVRRVG